MSGRSVVAVVVALVTLTGGVAIAAPPADRVLSAEQYTTDKGRALATAHVQALRALPVHYPDARPVSLAAVATPNPDSRRAFADRKRKAHSS